MNSVWASLLLYLWAKAMTNSRPMIKSANLVLYSRVLDYAVAVLEEPNGKLEKVLFHWLKQRIEKELALVKLLLQMGFLIATIVPAIKEEKTE